VIVTGQRKGKGKASVSHDPVQEMVAKQADAGGGGGSATTQTISNAQTTGGTEHAADAEAVGRKQGECGFAGQSCAFPQLYAIPCDRCGCSFHELCAQRSDRIQKSRWTSGCPTCYLDGGNASGADSES